MHPPRGSLGALQSFLLLMISTGHFINGGLVSHDILDILVNIRERLEDDEGSTLTYTVGDQV